MGQAQVNPQERITLFNARQRFFMVRSKLKELERFMDDIRDSRHPGVIDLATQFTILNSVSSAASRQFDNANARDLSSKDLRMLSNLEGLVYEFQAVLIEAHNELTHIS